MEGHKHQEINENGAPEGQKCCRGSKFKVAALGNAGCSFCIEGRVLGLEMSPEGRRKKMIFEDLISKRFLKRFSRFGRSGQGVRAPGSGTAIYRVWGLGNLLRGCAY